MAKTGAFQPSALCPQAGFFQQPVSDSRLSERIREPQPALSDPGQYRRHDAIAARRVELEGASRHLTDASGHGTADHGAGAMQTGLHRFFAQPETFSGLAVRQPSESGLLDPVR